MRRLKVGVSRSDKKLARRIVGYIERDKWKKLKKIFTHKSIHPGKFFKYRIAEFFTGNSLRLLQLYIRLIKLDTGSCISVEREENFHL